MSKRIKLGIISGYFNPIHSGHLDYIEGAKEICDFLYVIVNNDRQVKIKGSSPFMNENERLRIVRSLKPVDRAMIALDKDATVVESIMWLHRKYPRGYQAGREIGSPDYFVDAMIFMNGGDRKPDNSPEEVVCKKIGVLTAYEVGGGKTQSSSKLIRGVSNNA